MKKPENMTTDELRKEIAKIGEITGIAFANKPKTPKPSLMRTLNKARAEHAKWKKKQPEKMTGKTSSAAAKKIGAQVKEIMTKLDSFGVEYKKDEPLENLRLRLQIAEQVYADVGRTLRLRKKKATKKSKAKKEKKPAVETPDKPKNVVQIDAINAFQMGALIHFQSGRWGGKARIDDSVIEQGGLPSEHVGAVQDLLGDMSLLKELNRIKMNAKNFIRLNSVPFVIRSMHFVHKDRIGVVDEYLQGCKKRYFETSQELINCFDAKKEEFKQKIMKKNPSLWRPEKYPTTAALQKSFRFRWSFKVFKNPADGGMAVFSPNMQKQQIETYREDFKQLRENTFQLVGELFIKKIESLTKQCAGESVNLKTINGINRFLQEFDSQWSGFIGQDELRKQIERVRRQMKTLKVDMAKDNEEYRNDLGQAMQDVLKGLDKTSLRAKRKLNLAGLNKTGKKKAT